MPGRIVGLHVAPRTGAAMQSASSVECRADFGLAGDRYARAGSKGQVTLVSAEQLAEAAALLGRPIEAGAPRRNVTVEGIALPAPGGRVALGDALLEITGPAEPCSLMDECIAPGAMQALEGRAGMRARVLRGATLSVGDACELVADATAAGRAQGALPS